MMWTQELDYRAGKPRLHKFRASVYRSLLHLMGMASSQASFWPCANTVLGWKDQGSILVALDRVGTR